MKNPAPVAIHLKDYTPPEFLIDSIDLEFELADIGTRVTSKMRMRRHGAHHGKLVLNGEQLSLKEVWLDSKLLTPAEYKVDDSFLTINKVPDHFDLKIVNTIDPVKNTVLDGLYKSGGIFCTQNEPEGFRRITYYLDRPDVMAIFSTKIIADKKSYPVLLSNGNLIDEGELEGGRHWCLWSDPFPKPAYLYALVAGDLELVQDSYKTLSGREIDLRIYCDKGNGKRCHHAMESLKKSMRWDEETWGLEYDLEIYMIVSVDSFNMGAMENKGLNIFNSRLVLADQETATDENFLAIEAVVGHEYFHNWTGNRVTCRDWFQLTLKEGLTVFRDQEFSSDLNSRAVKRIEDVSQLRAVQFAEDSGPNAHPIRPSSYVEINNFYTPTVYEKGAEVIRMVQTLLGKEGFRKGMDKYFELYDGQAVTTDDFLHAMSVANNDFDFTQFKNWYTQAGTPELDVTTVYNEVKKELAITFKQSCRPTTECQNKLPYYFPLSIGLLGKNGKDQKIAVCSHSGKVETDRGLLHISREKEEFIFKNIDRDSVLSLNRSFSAPVEIKYPYSFEELAFIMANDSDTFNRYEASQKLTSKVLDKIRLGQLKKGELPEVYLDAFKMLLLDKTVDLSFKEMALSMPSFNEVLGHQNPVDIHGTLDAQDSLRMSLAENFYGSFLDIYSSLSAQKTYSLSPESVGTRAFKRFSLELLTMTKKEEALIIAKKQYFEANNMTDKLSALRVLVEYGGELGEEVSKDFYSKFKNNTLVIQMWLSVWSGRDDNSTIDRIIELSKDPVFDHKIPNLVRSLYTRFCANYRQFHSLDGRGYQFIADKIIALDSINPHISSGMAKQFKLFSKLPENLKSKMQTELERISKIENLSKNALEIVVNTLGKA